MMETAIEILEKHYNTLVAQNKDAYIEFDDPNNEKERNAMLGAMEEYAALKVKEYKDSVCPVCHKEGCDPQSHFRC